MSAIAVPARQQAMVRELAESCARVLVLIEATSIRGAAKSLLTFLRSIAQMGSSAFNVSVATFHRGGGDGQSNEFLEAVRELGVQTYIIWERRRWDTRVISSLRQVAAAADPHIIHTNNVKSHALVKAAGLHRDCRWIAFHHGYTTTDLKMRCYNHFDRWSLRSADCVVVPCRAFVRTQLHGCGVLPERIHILQNAGTRIRVPSAEEVRATRERFGIAPGEKLIISIGRMSSEKGHIDLVRSMKPLLEKWPALRSRLIVIGHGPELSKLQSEASKTGLVSRIAFATAEKDIAPFLHAADVFALPSHTEGSPHVLLEAMSAGVPIVATRVGGIPEMLTDNETAILVPARAPAAFAAGLARVLKFPQLGRRCSDAARGTVETVFSPEVYVNSILAIYRDVLTQSLSRGGYSNARGIPSRTAQITSSTS